MEVSLFFMSETATVTDQKSRVIVKHPTLAMASMLIGRMFKGLLSDTINVYCCHASIPASDHGRGSL